MPDTRVSPAFRPCRPGDPPPAFRPSARKAPRRDRVASRPRCGGLETKEKHHEQQANPYRLHRYRPERGQRPQSAVDRSRRRLAAQERQGLRPGDRRRDQPLRPHRLPRAQRATGRIGLRPPPDRPAGLSLSVQEISAMKTYTALFRSEAFAEQMRCKSRDILRVYTACLALWAKRERRGNRVRIFTSVPRRGFSLPLDPDLGEFSPEGIEQTRREKPIGVEVARAGEGAQVEARPRKFVHLVDDNP
jgi:hypothetical protein